MIQIAIVEDEDASAEELEKCLKMYSESSTEEFNITRFCDADSFLKNYQCLYGIIFMDIELPGRLNGFQAAEELRKTDSLAVLIFVTNLVKYVQKGYEVGALDYFIKPIKYPEFFMKLKKAVNVYRSNANIEITIPIANGIQRIASNDLLYMEVMGHKVIYHLLNDTIVTRGSLSEIEKNLKRGSFLRCNNCYLINPRHISYVKNYTVKIHSNELQISRARRKEFMAELMEWYSSHAGGGVSK